MGLATFLERTWSGITGLVKPRSASSLFRLADQCRHEGRYEDAAELITEGLRISPYRGRALGRYLHVVFREMPAAKASSGGCSALDPYHPRACSAGAHRAGKRATSRGAGRFSIGRSSTPGFPEAKALQEMVATDRPRGGGLDRHRTISIERLRLPPGAHKTSCDAADGTLGSPRGPRSARSTSGCT